MYSGPFRRFFAYMIDCTVLIGGYMFLAFVFGYSWISNPLLHLPMFGIWYFSGIFCFAWAYFALFESSKWQATIGKRALNLKVVDLEGRRISFLRATGRFFSQILTRFTLLIGYLMIFWTKKKQTLHDKMSSTVVIYQPETTATEE
ncbi:MAG: RDD family protein [Verrucomicrobia bacterium]|nr:RDD family protein [Verrucomicrobiota bacterium]